MERLTLAYPRAFIEPEVENVLDQIETFINENFPAGLTSADLLNNGHWVNSRVKTHGMMITLTDNNRTVWASGNGPTDPWVDYNGVNVYVPV